MFKNIKANEKYLSAIQTQNEKSFCMFILFFQFDDYFAQVRVYFIVVKKYY